MFYYGAHLAILAIYSLLDNDFKLQVQELRLFFPCVFFGLILISAYLFEICGSNPGYVSVELPSRELAFLVDLNDENLDVQSPYQGSFKSDKLSEQENFSKAK